MDDDAGLCALLSQRLEPEGFRIETTQNGIDGLERARTNNYSLIILDLMLPGLSGLEVLRRLRASSGVPVLILTARGDEVDRIVGLEIGADDYLAKPFNPRELIARMRAILRRTSHSGGINNRLAVGDLVLDSLAREATVNGQTVNLTSVEFALLEALATHAGRTMTRDELTEAVLGRKPGAFDRVIDVHVSNLRRKLGPEKEPERIKAVRGSGYVLVARSRPDAP